MFVPNEITFHRVFYQVLPDIVGAACGFLLLSECALLFLSCCAVLANVVSKGFVVIFYQTMSKPKYTPVPVIPVQKDTLAN